MNPSTPTKSEEARQRDAEAAKRGGDDEAKATLPVGHPQAGYVKHDQSFSDEGSTLPDSEKEWNEQRDKAHEEEADAVAEHEDEVVKAEQEAREKAHQDELDRLRSAPAGTLTPEQQAMLDQDELDKAAAGAASKSAPKSSSSSGSSSGSSSS